MAQFTSFAIERKRGEPEGLKWRGVERKKGGREGEVREREIYGRKERGEGESHF
jgi:hypothetical protein